MTYGYGYAINGELLSVLRPIKNDRFYSFANRKCFLYLVFILVLYNYCRFVVVRF